MLASVELLFYMYRTLKMFTLITSHFFLVNSNTRLALNILNKSQLFSETASFLWLIFMKFQ